MTSKILTFLGILLLLSCDDCAGTAADPIDQTKGEIMVKSIEDFTWQKENARKKADIWYIWYKSNEYIEMLPKGELDKNEVYSSWKLEGDNEDQLKLLFEGDYSDIENMVRNPDIPLTKEDKEIVEERKNLNTW